ncbi:MAG: sigma 54-interacting transcriptional regulator [Kofleriaceae bacterium]
MLRASLRADDFLVAESKAMREVAAQVEAYADGTAPVLITGEHGTGRELVARVLHQRSPRKAERFITVRPTFEGADVQKIASEDDCDRAHRALKAAANGTLVVKDMIDLSAPSQRTLKKAIQQKEGHDVHVVATADVDIEHAVDAAIVKRDFYDLFAPRKIEVPPLRDRIDDLPSLFERWIKHYAAEVGRAKPSISTRAHARLAEYPWPGNVGELKSIARRLIVRVQRNKIEAGDVDEVLPVVATRVPLEDLAFEEMVKAKLAGLIARIDGYPAHDLYEKVLARVERPLFDVVLAHTGGNQVKAAELLGLNRNTLRKKLADLGIESKKKPSREDRALDEA